MSDLFHEDVPADYIASVGAVMRQARWHTFQVLTKRHDRMNHLLAGELRWMGDLANVWYGVSVENRTHGLGRLDVLRKTPAVVRFASMEPLLEDLGHIDLTDIHWVIAGGESGPRARRVEEAWVVGIERQCKERGVPFFFGNGKQKRTPHHFASVFLRRRDGGRDGREVTGWRMDAAGAVDAKTRPPRLGHAADDVPTAPTSRFVIGLAKAWRMSIESVCYEFTR